MDEENQLTDVICFEKIDEINGITVFRCCVPNDPPKTSFEILPSEGFWITTQNNTQNIDKKDRVSTKNPLPSAYGSGTVINNTTIIDSIDAIDDILAKHGENMWILHFDCTGFALKHLFWLNRFTNLIIEKYEVNLIKIEILHSTFYIRTLLSMNQLFVTPKMQAMMINGNNMKPPPAEKLGYF